jgi:hypothetical protein
VELAENLLKGAELSHLTKNQAIKTLRLGNNKIASADELKVLVSALSPSAHHFAPPLRLN